MTSPPALAAAAGTLIAAVADARTGYIPNVVPRATALVALTAAACHGTVLAACGGALAVGGSLLALHLLTRGRGLGLGDVKLGAAIGAGFGPVGGALALSAAFAAGGVVGAWLLATRRARRGDALPFGPFLAAGTITALLLPAGVPW